MPFGNEPVRLTEFAANNQDALKGVANAFRQRACSAPRFGYAIRLGRLGVANAFRQRACSAH